MSHFEKTTPHLEAIKANEIVSVRPIPQGSRHTKRNWLICIERFGKDDCNILERNEPDCKRAVFKALRRMTGIPTLRVVHTRHSKGCHVAAIAVDGKVYDGEEQSNPYQAILSAFQVYESQESSN